MKLDAKFKMITTGTPIQNHLGELWNLFQFINPGMLGSAEEFNRRFVQNEGTPEGQQSRKSLNRYISPFILRRNKNEVFVITSYSIHYTKLYDKFLKWLI